MDSYQAAEDMGIQMKKRWLATRDNRTRHAHAMLDGQTVDVDKPFEIDGKQIMYPGDRSAAGYLVYNCRCTTIAVLPDVDTSDAERWSRDPETGERKLVSDMSYQEWAGWKEKEQKTVANARAVLNKHGQVILFDSRLESEHYSDSVSIIRQLSSEYDTKLVNVRNFEKGENTLSVAGDVSPFGEMRLSSNKKETAVHEFAHSLALTKDSKLGLDGNDAFWKEIRKVRSEYNKYIRQHPTDKISFYAADNVDEFFAEAFTHAKSKQLGIALPDYYGTDYTYSDKVLEIVDKYFKKDVASANGNDIIVIGKSLGAKARNYDISLPNKDIVHLTEGSRVTNVTVIAGKGRNREIDELPILIKRYPGSNETEWQKAKGLGYIDYEGESYKAELHWYQEPSVGRVEWKVKPDADGNWFIEEG